MAALNHSTIIKGFESLKGINTPAEFFMSFLKALKFSAATIKRLADSKGNRNVASVPGDFALSKQIYFHPGKKGEDLQSSLRAIVNDEALTKHQIRFYLSTDFENVVAYDRRVDDWTSFAHEDLRDNYEFFLPLTGLYEKPLAYTSHPADVKACEKMGKLYDVIRAQNHYDKEDLHDLNVFLTRLLFCFFAEDTGIFPVKGQLTNAIESLTHADGSDMASFFERLFWILDCEEGRAARRLETPKLAAFPYVNGGLFREKIRIPDFNAKARNILLECGRLEWNEISPVIFGSMFQAVMNPEARRELGAHYTSEKNIFKVIGPLFLDDLKTELEKLLNDKSTHRVKKLKDYQTKLTSLKFLDPACGCGNFLIVTYRELKKLELEAVKAIYGTDRSELSLFDDWKNDISKVSTSQFYGIELEEFPVDVARVSMWLMEHVMNIEFGKYFGQLFPSIPLKDSATILCANSLRTDWNKVIPASDVSYIVGNPPFSGARTMTSDQKADLEYVFGSDWKGVGNLDFVCCWHMRAIGMMKANPKIRAAFVSTNSICQGQHIGILWKHLFEDYGIKFDFAYRTFQWDNEATKKAHVHCIILGFSRKEVETKKMLVSEDGVSRFVSNISPYLLEGSNIFVESRNKPWGNIPDMLSGNQPIDGGFYLFSEEEKADFLKKEPEAKRFFKQWIGGREFINGIPRYCLWLGDAKNEELSSLPLCCERIKAVRSYRAASNREGTRRLAEKPTRFQVEVFSQSNSIVVPQVSSDRREYVPLGFASRDILCSNKIYLIPDGSLTHWGLLSSRMHMSWLNTISCRLETRLSYTIAEVYNTFPWPKISETQRQLIENLAQTVLMTREFYPDMTLADLYDPDKMPEDLRKAHHELDLAVERLYRKKPFDSDEERLAHLFARYEKLVKGEDDASLFNEE